MPATGPSRTPQEVFDSHLALAAAGRLEEDLAANYHPDCLVLWREGVVRGHDGIRALAERLRDELPGQRFDYVTRLCQDGFAFLEWTADESQVVVDDGADSFVIRDGRIVAQSIHYTVRRRA